MGGGYHGLMRRITIRMAIAMACAWAPSLVAQVTFPPADGQALPDGWSIDASSSYDTTQQAGDSPQIEPTNEWWLYVLGQGLTSHQTGGALGEGQRWSPVGSTVQGGGSRQVAGVVEAARVDIRAYRSSSSSSYGEALLDQGADSALYFIDLDSASYGNGSASSSQSIVGDLNTKAKMLLGPLGGLTNADLGAYVHVEMDVIVSAGAASCRVAVDGRSAVVDDPDGFDVGLSAGPFGVTIEPLQINGLDAESHHHHISKSNGLAAQQGVTQVVVAFNAEADFKVEAEKGVLTPGSSVLEAEAKALVASKAVVTLGATKQEDGKVFEGDVEFEQVVPH